jgi:hypothetical protein
MVDITNHYILQGITGGLVKFALFIAIITACFKIAGRNARDESAPASWQYLAWTLGVCLACHCTSFISVAYFDQIQVYWFWVLAALASMPAAARARAETEQARQMTEEFDDQGMAVTAGAE